MIISILLTAGLGLLLLYAWLQLRTSRMLFLSMTIICFFGIVLIWNPELSQAVAATVGVGRGVDLVIYVWILVSLFVSFNLHLQIRRERERFTELVRELALTSRSKSPEATTPLSLNQAMDAPLKKRKG